MTSISIGDLGRADELLSERPSRVWERGAHDFPAMWYTAIGGGSVEAAEMLIDYGAPVDQETMSTTVLHRAAARGELDLIYFLAEKGADVDKLGFQELREGLRPPAAAEMRGQAEAATLLKELGAS